MTKKKQPLQNQKDKLREKVGELVKIYQKVLELDHWRIDLFFQKASQDDRAGECHPSFELQWAKITFDLDHPEWNDPEFQHLFVIHELLHCVTSGWALEVEENISNYVGEELQDEVRRRTNRQEEVAICTLARIIYNRGVGQMGPESLPLELKKKRSES